MKMIAEIIRTIGAMVGAVWLLVAIALWLVVVVVVLSVVAIAESGRGIARLLHVTHPKPEPTP